MKVFLILVALSAGFMVIALIQFVREGRRGRRPNGRTESESSRPMGGFAHMWDVIFLGSTALFFILGILYVGGCERLR